MDAPVGRHTLIALFKAFAFHAIIEITGGQIARIQFPILPNKIINPPPPQEVHPQGKQVVPKVSLVPKYQKNNKRV
jgi:hypothetical protein